MRRYSSNNAARQDGEDYENRKETSRTTLVIDIRRVWIWESWTVRVVCDQGIESKPEVKATHAASIRVGDRVVGPLNSMQGEASGKGPAP